VSLCSLARLNEKTILFPSQTRYINYFASVQNGFTPSDTPIFIQRVIMSGLPSLQDKVRAYLQIFKNGRLIFSSANKQDAIAELVCSS